MESTKEIILHDTVYNPPKEPFEPFVVIESGRSKFIPATDHTVCFMFKTMNVEITIAELQNLFSEHWYEGKFIRS